MERLTTRDLAARTHLAPQTILNYVKEGLITPIDTSPDGRYYFEMSVADDLITRNLLKKYPNHTAVVILYKNEDSMKAFENTYNNYLKNEGILRIDNLAETVTKVRESIEKNALYDRVFCMYLCKEIIKKCKIEREKLKSSLPAYIMQNPKLEDRNLLLENLDVLTSDSASVLEKLNPNDKKIVKGAINWLTEEIRKVYERYTLKDITDLLEQLSASKDKDEHFEFPIKTKTIENMYRKGKQSYYAKALSDQFKKLKKGYQSLIKIDCSAEDSIYDLLYKTRYTEHIKFYGCENATKEMEEVIRFLQDTKQTTDYGEMDVR